MVNEFCCGPPKLERVRFLYSSGGLGRFGSSGRRRRWHLRGQAGDRGGELRSRGFGLRRRVTPRAPSEPNRIFAWRRLARAFFRFGTRGRPRVGAAVHAATLQQRVRPLGGIPGTAAVAQLRRSGARPRIYPLLQLSDLLPDDLPRFCERKEPLGIQPFDILFSLHLRDATMDLDHIRGRTLYMLIRQRQWKTWRQWKSFYVTLKIKPILPQNKPKVNEKCIYDYS